MDSTQEQQQRPNLSQMLEQFYPGVQFTFAQDIDDACLGVVANSELPRLAYSVAAAVQIIQEQQQITFEEAFQYFYNIVLPSVQGDNTPAWIDDTAFIQFMYGGSPEESLDDQSQA
jgi:hypothetical protein